MAVLIYKVSDKMNIKLHTDNDTKEESRMHWISVNVSDKEVNSMYLSKSSYARYAELLEPYRKSNSKSDLINFCNKITESNGVSALEIAALITGEIGEPASKQDFESRIAKTRIEYEDPAHEIIAGLFK